MHDSQIHMVEVTLRDCRNIGVIMAMDRLVALPQNVEHMQEAMADMQIVREFATERVPPALREVAKNVFMEHANFLINHLKP